MPMRGFVACGSDLGPLMSWHQPKQAAHDRLLPAVEVWQQTEPAIEASQT